MHLDPHFQEISLVILCLMFAGVLSNLIKLPNAVGFLISGVVIGPHVLNIVQKDSVLNQIGAAGVVLLLFFLGMELSPKDLVKEWKITLVGTFLQILLSVASVLALGYFFQWPWNRSILIGFVISLSSTTMVIQILKKNGIQNTRMGKDVLGILVAQDILIVPMLIIIGMLGDKKLDYEQLIKQIFGGIFLVSSFVLAPNLKKINFKFLNKFENDDEIKLLFCLSFALVMALISGLLELSTALGAFVAGGIITQLELGKLFHHSLHSFKIVTNAIFFSSIGLLLNFNFFKENYFTLLIVTVIALATNTIVNAIILKMLGRGWRESILSSSFLSQIGEFSFILAAIGLQQNVINNFGYQTTIFIIFFSILLTPTWVSLFAKITGYKLGEV